MKRLLIALVAVAALALVAGNAKAEEKYVMGGFEMAGHVNTGLGFDYVGANSDTQPITGTNAFVSGLARDGWSNMKQYDKAKNFGFLLDEVELNLMKTFGENIRARVDIAFGDQNIGSRWNGVYLKQAYVTANLPAGNGIELLAGRFDAPIGYEAVDRNDNNTITRSSIYNYHIRPTMLTGMKLYYAFSDAIDLHVWLANNLQDDIGNAFNADNKIMPAVGGRLGYTWGDEGTQSTVGVSAAYSPETVAGGKMGRTTFLVDLDWNIYATEAFTIGGEGIYRQNHGANGATTTSVFGGILDLNYAFSDVWDGTLKYSILRPNNGNGTADANFLTGTNISAYNAVGGVVSGLGVQKGYLQEMGACIGYQITDGAKFKAEYRLDWTKYSGINKNLTHTALGMFEYMF